MNKIIVILVVFIVPFCILAQNDRQSEWENFKRQHDFGKYKQQREAQFQAYRDSINKEFAKAIDKRWEDFQVFVGKKREVKPEPAQLPVAPKDSVKAEPISLPIDVVLPIPEETPSLNDFWEEEPLLIQDTFETAQPYKHVDINFYMQRINFNVPVSYEQLILGGISEHAVAKFWSDLSEGGFNACISQFKTRKREFNLNDWALYDMVTSVAAETFPRRYAEQTIFSVFMLNQLGISAKIGRTNNQLIILMSAKTTIYAVSYVVCEGDTYYIFSCYPKEQQNISSISTYPVTFPNPTMPLDLNIYTPIKFVKQPSPVTYISDFWGDAIPFQVNQNAIDFYSAYPQVDIAIYANSEMSDELKMWTNKQIKPFLDDLDEYEALNVLLYYVQTEFDYATDIQQFGYEKPFFCEENFYYDKNDCEDRAILLSYLVRNLVGSKIVLLDYPDHIATAIALSDDTGVVGDYYEIDGRKYYVCDPTYIGANIGDTMPKYRNVKADIIMLK